MEKIFISSTCYDLIDLRAVLEKEIKGMGLTPIMSDRLNSDFEIQTHTNSIETCLINLRKCKAVIVILSQRYGPSLKNSGFSDVSATHLEYREAIKNNIPIYFYVRDLFEADFNIYDRTKNSDLLKWVRKKDFKIFELFKEHKNLKNDSKNNWYYTFSDVNDLISRIQIDLKKQSSSVLLNRIIESGDAPCIIIENVKAEIISKTKVINFSVVVKNIGNSVAVQPYINFNEYMSEKERDEKISEIEEDTLKRVDTLFPKQDFSLSYNIEIPEWNIENNEFSILFEASYSTITGHYLSDLSELEFYFNEDSSKVKEVFYSYESKKYYHSSAIKRVIKDNE